MNWTQTLCRHPWATPTGLGLTLALITVPASLGVVTLAEAALPPAWLGESAARDLGELSWPAALFFVVLFGPALETFIGQAAPLGLMRRLSIAIPARVAVCGLFFGAMHWLAGGLGHGLSTATAGTLFALAYALCRPAGFWPAAYAAFVAHSTHNFLVWFVVGPILN